MAAPALEFTWRWKARLPDRYGQPCRVFARGRLNSVGVEFADGTRVVASRFALRRRPPPLQSSATRRAASGEPHD